MLEELQFKFITLCVKISVREVTDSEVQEDFKRSEAQDSSRQGVQESSRLQWRDQQYAKSNCHVTASLISLPLIAVHLNYSTLHSVGKKHR